MFALRGEFDVADQHEIVVARGFTERAVKRLRRTLMVALIKFVEGFDDPARRIQQALAGRVFADITEQGLNRVLGRGARRTRLVCTYGSRQKFCRMELDG